MKGEEIYKPSLDQGRPKDREEDSIRTLKILEEVANGKPLTQRDLSRKLGIGLGMVNSYLKRLAQQGHIQIVKGERKRLYYLLTPMGIAEKSTLAYRYIRRSYQVFTEARARIWNFFNELEKEGVKSIVLYKATVITEISLLALQGSSLDLMAIVDDAGAGRKFLGHRIQPLDVLRSMTFDRLIITTEELVDKVAVDLATYGVEKGKICRF